MSFFDKKTGPGISLNEQLAEEWHKTVTKNSKEQIFMQGLKTIFRQQM